MTKVHFYEFIPYEDGLMGNFDLLEEDVPINIFIDNADEFKDLSECDAEVEIYGVYQGLKVFKTEEEYNASGTHMAVESMIPTGTFAPKGKQDGFQQSPTILYNGIVKDVDKDEEAEEGRPNYCLTIQTYGMTFKLFARYDGQIEKGNIVSGNAWLYGDISIPKGDAEK